MGNPLNILIVLLWLLLGYFYWDASKNCCADSSEGTIGVMTNDSDKNEGAASTITNKVGPLMFRWNSEGAITGEGWEAKKSEILSNLGSDKLLEIIGLYRAEETNSTKFENLGIARANEARKLFSSIPDDRIRLLGRLTDSEINKDSPFESCEFDFKINTANVKEVEDKTLIYFPFNSTNKLNDNEVEKYLDDVATRVKQTGEKVLLTGHTDNIGSDLSNLNLGRRRAQIIANYLTTKGVNKSNITIDSKGESSPIANNDSENGRAQNRRTELQIIK